MKVISPIGEYQYEVKRVAFRRGRLEVVGALGEWETTMVVEPSDWLELARRAAPALTALGAIALAVAAARARS
jgi:hypothetical protein